MLPVCALSSHPGINGWEGILGGGDTLPLYSPDKKIKRKKSVSQNF